jgi:hypothetical protein
MADAHQRFENQQHAHARRHFSRFPGVHHLSFNDVAAIGRGDMAAGEAVLNKLFEGHMVAPRSIAVSGLRALGNGNIAAGRKVLEKFIANLRARQETGTAKENERPQARYARGGKVGKVSKQSVNYRQAEDNAFCARCTMYREPASCTAVEGRIHRVDLCDLYEQA